MSDASKSQPWWPFALLIVGTAGLLANEFAGPWGRGATLALAGLNVVGLAGLAVGRRTPARR